MPGLLERKDNPIIFWFLYKIKSVSSFLIYGNIKNKVAMLQTISNQRMKTSYFIEKDTGLGARITIF